MMTQETEKKEEREAAGKGNEGKPPKGKVRCYISKQTYNEDEIVELDYNGVTVKVHKRYSRV